MIGALQAAFIPNRSIQDNLLLSHSLIKGYGRKRISRCCALKVDIQKAYDSVHWGAIELVLRRFGLPEVCVSWVSMCCKTANYSITVNGIPRGKRGLRQGDPISPYLFVLVMKVFGSLLKEGIQDLHYFLILSAEELGSRIYVLLTTLWSFLK